MIGSDTTFVVADHIVRIAHRDQALLGPLLMEELCGSNYPPAIIFYAGGIPPGIIIIPGPGGYPSRIRFAQERLRIKNALMSASE